MPRKRIITITSFPPYKAGVRYPCSVTDLRPSEDGSALEVTLVHVAPEQEGRDTRVAIPLPIHVAGCGARFLAALGYRVAVREQVSLQDCVGNKLMVIFGSPSLPGQEPVVENFEPYPGPSDGAATDGPPSISPSAQPPAPKKPHRVQEGT